MPMDETSTTPSAQPPITPEVFFKEKVAPQFQRRIDDLRRQIISLEQQVKERVEAQATIQVVIEGKGSGTWYLNVNAGEMALATEPMFPPLMIVYQPRPYFDWAVSIATEAGLFGPNARNTQNELTKSRIERLKQLKGLILFVFTDFPDGSDRTFCLQLGDGERPATPQTTLSMKAADAQKMAQGEINPQAAFMGGIMQVSGDMALAMQFGTAMM